MRLSLILAACALLSGCATILNGPMEQVGIETTPAGATCSVDGLHVISPAVVTLRRDTNYKVECKKDGFSSSALTFVSTFENYDSYFLGNILFGGMLIGMIVDSQSGAANGLSPTIATFNLTQDVTKH